MRDLGLKRRLASGEVAVGSWITLAHPAIAEILARSGYRWIGVDLEHSVISLREAEELMRVIELCGAAPLVRLTSNDPNQIKRVMDAGAHGVLVPNVNSRGEAQRAVDAVCYPPIGRRGVGLARGQGYGADFEGYRRWLEQGPVVIAMIEHAQGVRHARSILSVKGIDGCFIGPYDLSASLGVPGQLGHPKVRRAMEQVRLVARRLGKPAGLHIVEPEPSEVERRIREGYRFLAYSLDIRMLDVAARRGVVALRTDLLDQKDGSRDIARDLATDGILPRASHVDGRSR